MNNRNSTHKPMLQIQKARYKDIAAIMQLCKKVYPNEPAYSSAMIRGQLSQYPQGQFVAIYEGKLVGYCSTFKISEKIAMSDHSWDEITGGGFASRHDDHGDYLYGLEVCVDPDCRGLRIGRRFYEERRKLVIHERLKGIIFAGRMPGLRRKIKSISGPEEYLEGILNKKYRDSTLSFQLRNGFEPIRIIEGYNSEDKESLGYGVLMQWKNPESVAATTSSSSKPLPKSRVRVASIQYKQRRVKSFDEFIKNAEYFIDVVASYEADFAVFPELFTLQLLSVENKPLRPAKAIETLTQYTERFKEAMAELAVRYNVNIIGGSHPTHTDKDTVQNISYVFLRDGSIHEQAKIHPTPDEKYWWNISGGSSLQSIPTDCGQIGVLICYDSEFPELARHLTDQGAQILFVPFCTDERQSYLRVRYCAQARAVENQCYVVMSGNVGNLPGVENMDIQYAQSCILTPCDFPFARDGVAADTTPNVETVAIADLKIDDLIRGRNSGTVQNLKNRRHDLYKVVWKGK